MANVELMSPVDVAWLSMEEPTNLMMVNAVITFDRPLDVARVRQVLEYRWLRYGRFRQRVVRPPVPLLRPYWQDDPHFDLGLHLQRTALPAPGDRAALQNMVSDLMSTPLDFSRPPWKFYIIENYGQGCAIMARTHHCLADGMALVAVLLAMTDFTPDAPLTPGEPLAGAPANGLMGNGLLGGLTREVGNTVGLARELAGRAARGARAVAGDADRAVGLGEQGAGFGLAAGRLLARSADPRTRLKGKLGVMKRAAWSPPFPLNDIKLIKNALGGTINDVLVTAVAGGLRRYLVAAGDDVGDDSGGLEIRAALPVNLRGDDDLGKLGNKFGLVFLTLPIHIEEPLMRLAEVRRRMLELKRSAEAPVTLSILGAMGLGTDAFREFVVRTLEPKATIVLTNVPGPPIPLYLAGQQIRELMFWVPQAGRLGVGVSILSYAGNVHLGIATDAGLVPDPERVLVGVHAELARLKALANAVNRVQT
ncbi:MAG: wax ester/triacylglycerol synthase family O-acyltransferase [Candidatus Promineofilum sp.]|nr:wax ester/triacylglycerol synthase family O-acyltransferase [Promineifilum sp.]